MPKVSGTRKRPLLLLFLALLVGLIGVVQPVGPASGAVDGMTVDMAT